MFEMDNKITYIVVLKKGNENGTSEIYKNGKVEVF